MNLGGQRLGNCETSCIHLDIVNQKDFAILNLYVPRKLDSFTTKYYCIIAVTVSTRNSFRLRLDHSLLREKTNRLIYVTFKASNNKNQRIFMFIYDENLDETKSDMIFEPATLFTKKLRFQALYRLSLEPNTYFNSH